MNALPLLPSMCSFIRLSVVLSDYLFFRVTSRVPPFIKTKTSFSGSRKTWPIWNQLLRLFRRHYGTSGRYVMKNFSMERMYHQLTPFISQLPLKPNAGEKQTYLRKERKMTHNVLSCSARLSRWTSASGLSNRCVMDRYWHGQWSRMVLQGSNGNRDIWTIRMPKNPINSPCRDGRTHIGDVLLKSVSLHRDSYREGLFQPV